MPLTKLTGKPSDLLRVVLPAAARGDLPSVKRLVGEDPAWLYRVGPHGRTMLWEAVYKQRLKTVRFLIDAGADVNSAGTYYTPLMVDLSPYCVARRAHNDSIATLLVENGATTDLHSAAYLGDVRSVERALRAQPDRVDEPYPARRRQPLQRHSVDAPLTKPVEDRLRLIDGRLRRSLNREIKAAHQRADHARTQWEGEAALLGLDSRYFEAIEELAELVQQVVAGRFTRRTAPVRRRLLLHRRRAIDRWQQNIFRESHAGVHDHRPLHYAVVANQVAVAQVLIERGASIQPYSKKLIEVASEFDDGQMLKLLLDHGADLGAAADPSWADDPRLMALVEQAGLTLDFHREAGQRPALVEACTANMTARDDPSRVQAILDRGCPVDIRDRHGKTGLHRAARAGFVKIPRLLLQRGADLEAVDHAGETPLFDAVRAGRLAVTKLLVQAGASLKMRNTKGTRVAEVAQRARRNEAAAVRAWLQQQID